MPKGIYKHYPQQGFQKGHPCYHTEESKGKISEFQKGRKLSEETKRKISRALKGKPKPWFKGISLSEEVFKKTGT